MSSWRGEPPHAPGGLLEPDPCSHKSNIRYWHVHQSKELRRADVNELRQTEGGKDLKVFEVWFWFHKILLLKSAAVLWRGVTLFVIRLSEYLTKNVSRNTTGFATYMQYYAVAKLHKEWKLMNEFPLRVLFRAMAVDVSHYTHPIKSEVNNAPQIQAMFDSISYEKGDEALVLKALLVKHAVRCYFLLFSIRVLPLLSATVARCWSLRVRESFNLQ